MAIFVGERKIGEDMLRGVANGVEDSIAYL
jgi:hypothetical protein